MSKPTKALIDHMLSFRRDSEAFHSAFDDELEEKLDQLDPEWMNEMRMLYAESGCDRWCA